MPILKKFFGKKSNSEHIKTLDCLSEMHRISVKFNFILGEEKQIPDPLGGAGFDIADLYIENSNTRLKSSPFTRLKSSPFLHLWSGETEQIFSAMKGIWLSEKSKSLFIGYEFGQKIHAYNPDWAVFFPVQESHHGTEAQLVLEVTCMN